MAAVVGPTLHPSAGPLAFLLGTWKGEGQGLWSSENPFRYREEITFGHVGKPFLQYQQKTSAMDDGRPLHSESGYLRSIGGGKVEFVIAQPTGFAEIHTGTVTDERLDLELLSLSRTPHALNVTALSRSIWLDNGSLAYLLRLAMNDEPIADHLTARLRQDV